MVVVKGLYLNRIKKEIPNHKRGIEDEDLMHNVGEGYAMRCALYL